MNNRTTDWIILRTAGANTLALARSLNEAGYEAWAPADDDMPMTVSYVFARMSHLAELLELARSPSLLYRVWDSEQQKMVTKGHPHFRLMPSLDGQRAWAPVADGQLAALRMIERRRKPRGIVKAIPVGTTVRLTQGGFEGIEGKVDSLCGNKHAVVLFKGFPVPVRVAMWILREALDGDTDSGVSRCPTKQAA